MKKKLALKKETLRTLQLEAVRGGCFGSGSVTLIPYDDTDELKDSPYELKPMPKR